MVATLNFTINHDATTAECRLDRGRYETCELFVLLR